MSPPGTHFTAESTEAMRIKSLAQGENILMLRFEPATFVSKIDIQSIIKFISNQIKKFDIQCTLYNIHGKLFYNKHVATFLISD